MGTRLRIWVLGGLLVCLGWGTVSAQAPQPSEKKRPPLPEPALVVRFPSYEGLLDDIDYLGQLAGNPEASQHVEALLALLTAGRGLQGLDKDRSGGAVMVFLGLEAEPLVFLPCSDAQKLVELLELFAEELRPVEPATDKFPRFYRCELSDQRFYLRTDPKWLWLARSKQLLERVPASPLPWLKRLRGFDLAAELRIRRLPLLARLSMKMMFLSRAYQRTIAEGQDLDQAKLDQVKQEVEHFFKVLDSIDRIVLGTTLDAQKRTWQLGLAFDLLPQSFWSTWAGMFRKGPTLHRGFVSPQAVLSFAFTTQLDAQGRQFLLKEILELDTPERLKQQARIWFEDDEEGLTESEAPEFMEWAEQILQLVRQVVLGGTLDLCAAVERNDQGSWFLLGVTIPEKEEVQQRVQQLLEPLAQFRTETIGQSEWKLARFAVEDEDLEELLGSGTVGAVALGPRTVYLVFGPEAEKLLRKRLASPLLGKPTPSEHVLQARMNLAELIRLAHQLEPDEETEELVKRLPKDAAPLLFIYGSYSPRQERYRVELNEEALQLLIDLFRWGFNQALEEELVPEF